MHRATTDKAGCEEDGQADPRPTYHSRHRKKPSVLMLESSSRRKEVADNVQGSLTPALQRGCAANPHARVTVTTVLAAKAGFSPPQREPCVIGRHTPPPPLNIRFASADILLIRMSAASIC
jgi:hypothetical protein